MRRYRPDGLDIVSENGGNRFNRPLYGSNTAFYVYAGDRPEFMLSLPGKGGTLWFGLIAGEAAKWLSDADRIAVRYRAGAMQYEVTDALLGPGSLTIDVIPRPESEGAVIRVTPSTTARPVRIDLGLRRRIGIQSVDQSRYLRLLSRIGLLVEAGRLR